MSRVSVTPARQHAAFSPQSQALPLNPQAYTALETLKRHDTSGHNSALQQTLDKAAKYLTETVVEINDRLSEEKVRRQERLQKLRKNGGKEEEGKAEELEEYQRKVETLTRSMDESIRKIVDDEQFSKNSPGWVQHVMDKSKEFQQRDERALDDEDDDQDEEHAGRNTVRQPDASENGTAIMKAAQMIADADWRSQSLTERYSNNNTYADFYKMLWDSRNPGDYPPPLPDPSMWFATQEGRNAGRSSQRATQRSATQTTIDNDGDEQMTGLQDEDTEIQMTSDVRSVKCPLTMRYFEEPVTSTLCPHSFENSAILSFIRESDKRLPLTPEQEKDLDSRYPRGHRGRDQAATAVRNRNPKCVQCPVTGCKIMTLTTETLRPDNVLLRMTKRAQEAERREQEDEEGGPEELEDSSDDDLPATQRRKKKKVVAIGSSPMGKTERRRTLVKPERAVSVIPNSQVTQTQSGRSQARGGFVVDDDDEDEEE